MTDAKTPLSKASHANREYKSTLLIESLCTNGDLISTSNAFLNTHYALDAYVQRRTLENVLYMGYRNDLAFEIDKRLIVLIEHQSTINENMPYRILQYIAATYERLNAKDDVYRKDKITLLRPAFIVLYNGVEPLPQEVMTLRLSDMFADCGADADDIGVDLELTVKIYDINNGRNADKVKACTALHHYCIFTEKVRQYNKTMELRDAILLAADECIDGNILKDVLTKHKQELVSMLTTEWNMDTALRVAGEEGEVRGEAREREKNARAIRAMKDDGVDVDTIARWTGMTVDDILRL